VSDTATIVALGTTESCSACGSAAFGDVLCILLALTLTATDIDVIGVGPVVIIVVIVIAFAPLAFLLSFPLAFL
jgi:hypothetical protein